MVSAPAGPADSFADQVLPYARQLHSAALRPAWLHRIQANTFYGTCRTRSRARLAGQMEPSAARAA
jgi:hypothetical protein